jgi:HTH-type transcriptional regulator / antitoxin HigA
MDPDATPGAADFNTIAPGETLRDTLDALGLSQRDLAHRTGMSTKTVNQIVQGVAPITHDTALKLERATGVPARLWNNLEAEYREQLARARQDELLAEQMDWVDELPLKALRDAGIVTKTKRDRLGVLKEFVSFFGVIDRETYEQSWGRPVAAFRQSPKLKSDPVAVAAWLRKGEIEAASLRCETYDEEAFTQAIRDARSLITEEPTTWVPLISRSYAEAGVALVLLPEVRGARAFGASRWLTPHKAVVQLSLRQRWEDQFWFSLFHETCHVLRHPKKHGFVSDGDPEDPFEREANDFAARVLIPREFEARLRTISTLAEVPPFAREVGVPPGIVVGRLQRLGTFHYSVGNNLRRRLAFTDDV